MALYKYLSRSDCHEPGSLPDPAGPLSASSIQAANDMVKPVLTPPSTGKKRGQYKHYTAEEKARIAKRSVQCGVTNTVRHFPREFADRPLSEATVRTWVKQYKCELRLRKQKNA